MVVVMAVVVVVEVVSVSGGGGGRAHAYHLPAPTAITTAYRHDRRRHNVTACCSPFHLALVSAPMAVPVRSTYPGEENMHAGQF